MGKKHRIGICAVLLAGCAGEVVDVEGGILTEVVADEERAQVLVDAASHHADGSLPPDAIARVARGRAWVAWIAPEEVDDVLVLIGGSSEDPPMIDMDTAESLGAVELFAALAPAESRVPARLLEYASEAEFATLEDPAAIDALRGRIATKMESVRARRAAEIAQAGPQPQAPSCTASQIATARSVYGIGYTSGATCGEHRGFETRTRHYEYCNGGDCEYPLGQIDGSTCPLNNPCDHASGTLTAVTMRSNTNGNPNFVHHGYRIRSFALNCNGTGDHDGALRMRVRHGSSWDREIWVPSGEYRGAYWNGSGHLPARARAISLVANGNIGVDIPTGGSGWAETQYQIGYNTAGNDRGIFCSGVQRSLTVTPGNPSSCGHGFVHWCTSYCGGCFD